MAFFSIAIEFAVLPVVCPLSDAVWPPPDAAADGVQPVSGLLLAGAGAEVCASAGVTAKSMARDAATIQAFIFGS